MAAGRNPDMQMLSVTVTCGRVSLKTAGTCYPDGTNGTEASPPSERSRNRYFNAEAFVLATLLRDAVRYGTSPERAHRAGITVEHHNKLFHM